MEIVSIQFFFFTATVLFIYRLLPRRMQNFWLLAASYYFVYTWQVSFFFILLSSSVFNYWTARKIESSSHKRTWLGFGLAINISALLYFKIGTTSYFSAILGLLSRLSPSPEGLTLDILLPIGFSFYILGAISYLVDVYREQIAACKDLPDFALYMAYFPKMVSGPIERAKSFLPQLAQERKCDHDQRDAGVVLILIGLVRKIVISGLLFSQIPETIFSAPDEFATFDLLIGPVLYGFWLYNDFAGYTNIIRGVSTLFGIRLSANFRQPHFARSFTEFWNQWHISFSHWLRDYIFFPLSRSLLKRNADRRNPINVVLPPLVTMLASGLWHFFGVYMLVWGAMHGLFQIVERLGNLWKPPLPPDKQPFWRQTLGRILVLIFSSLAWVAFASGGFSKALTYWLELLSWHELSAAPMMARTLPLVLVLLSLLLDWAQYRSRDEVVFLRWPLPVQGFLASLAILGILYARFLWTEGVNTTFLYQTF